MSCGCDQKVGSLVTTKVCCGLEAGGTTRLKVRLQARLCYTLAVIRLDSYYAMLRCDKESNSRAAWNFRGRRFEFRLFCDLDEYFGYMQVEIINKTELNDNILKHKPKMAKIIHKIQNQ